MEVVKHKGPNHRPEFDPWAYFRWASKQLAELDRTPTVDDLEAYFRVSQALPSIDFGEHFEQAKRRNSPEYQAAVAAAEALMESDRKIIEGKFKREPIIRPWLQRMWRNGLRSLRKR